MLTNPLKQSVLTENAAELGTVTRKMVRERAVALAVAHGRSAQRVSKSDWELAKLELTGEAASPSVSAPPDSKGLWARCQQSIGRLQASE